MITTITKNNRTFQAYKEIGILRNVIIEIYELIKVKSPFGDMTDHKFIKSQGTDFIFNETWENDIQLIKLAENMINEIK